jgi:NTP pyrophosphatase (non-canonical NTP hydrolase)
MKQKRERAKEKEKKANQSLNDIAQVEEEEKGEVARTKEK